MSIRRAAVPALAALFLAACSAGDAPTGPALSGTRAAATPDRPITGRCATTFGFLAPTPDQPRNVQRLRFDGTCQLSHLGRTTVAAVQTVTFGASGTTITNGATYTAANGDELRSSYEATGSFPDAAGNVCFSGTERYVGGTGRFADARGESRLDGCASVVSFTGAYAIDGRIAY